MLLRGGVGVKIVFFSETLRILIFTHLRLIIRSCQLFNRKFPYSNPSNIYVPQTVLYSILSPPTRLSPTNPCR